MSSLSPGVRCAKGIMLCLCFCFFVAGLVVIVVGVWCAVGEGRFAVAAAGRTKPPVPTLFQLAYGLAAAGGLVLVAAVGGAWAAVNESRCGIIWYIAAMLVVVGGQITVGVLGLSYKGGTVPGVEQDLTLRLQDHYGVPGHMDFTTALDYVQYKMQCCGVKGHGDWAPSLWRIEGHGGPELVVPLTCCTLHPALDASVNPRPLNSSLCQSKSPADYSATRHQQGCLPRLLEWLRAQSGIIVGVSIGVGLLEASGVASAAVLFRALGSHPG
ncbi:tetraspanin 68C [Oratosquilla oratoria]|uniref:tetraspanin 68C n=1 Tax=Oratosquilla oratoria TaxID=337810 RepID=UPI003F76FE82